MKRDRRMAATDLRVNLGAALRSLDDGDIVIEKGGVPVAVLSRYGDRVRGATEVGDAASYTEAISKPADRSADALARALAAMDVGWSGLDPDEAIENIYRRRDEGASDRHVDLTKEAMIADAPPAGQRHLYRHPRGKGRNTT